MKSRKIKSALKSFISVIMTCIIVLALPVGGYIFSATHFEKPISDNEISHFEELALAIYNQGIENVEIPDNIYVVETSSTTYI